MSLIKIKFWVRILSAVFFSTMTYCTNAQNLRSTQQMLSTTEVTQGISYEMTGHNLSLFIERDKVLKTIPKLQKKGIIDPRLSPAEIMFYQSLLPAAVSLNEAAQIVRKIYLANPEFDRIKVEAYLVALDLYGNEAKVLCYAFDFNRQVYQKINWAKFRADNIKRLAPNFKSYGPCQNILQLNLNSL